MRDQIERVGWPEHCRNPLPRGSRVRAGRRGSISSRCWTPRAPADSVLLIAPTGGGKTLAGFLPTLVALSEAPRAGIHTLYVSPLKALANDIARNLTRPVEEMRLSVSIETRTGDTPANRRARQRVAPPNILLTTPESLAVLLSLAGCAVDVRRACLRGDGRGACAGRHQARRSTGTVRCAADDAGAGVPPCRTIGDSGAPRRDPRLCRRRAGDRAARRHAARARDDAARGGAVLVRSHGPGGSAWGDGTHPRPPA